MGDAQEPLGDDVLLDGYDAVDSHGSDPFALEPFFVWIDVNLRRGLNPTRRNVQPPVTRMIAGRLDDRITVRGFLGNVLLDVPVLGKPAVDDAEDVGNRRS